MWHLDRIPKIAHFYWATDLLPWIRYLSLETFKKHNPDWQIILWKKENLTNVSESTLLDITTRTKVDTPVVAEFKNWWGEVEKLYINIQIVNIRGFGLDLSKYGDQSNIKDVHLSDFVYSKTLYDYGGFWGNMDMLFYKPLEDGVYNHLNNLNKEVICLIGGFNNFILSIPQSEFMQDHFNSSKAVPLKNIQDNYSATGPCVIEEIKKKSGYKNKILEIPSNTTEYKFQETNYYRSGELGEFPPETIAIHWHGAGRWDTHWHLTPENYKQDTSLIGKLVQRALG